MAHGHACFAGLYEGRSSGSANHMLLKAARCAGDAHLARSACALLGHGPYKVFPSFSFYLFLISFQLLHFGFFKSANIYKFEQF
jgi:hypothetical protein